MDLFDQVVIVTPVDLVDLVALFDSFDPIFPIPVSTKNKKPRLISESGLG